LERLPRVNPLAFCFENDLEDFLKIALILEGSNAKKLGEPKTDADYGWGDEGNIFLGAMLKE
jgi:hypothetical protein